MRGLTILILFLSFLSNAQNMKNNESSNVNNTVCNPDSSGLFQIRYNDTYNVYEFYKILRYFYTYNSNGELTNTLLLSTWGNDTTWVNLNNWTNTYDSNNNLIDSIYQNWNFSSWINNAKHTFSYDSNNNCLSITEKLFGTSTGNWSNYLETLNTYNVTNKQISSKNRQWDYINNFWWDTDSIKYNYDLNNTLVSHTYYKSPYGVNPNWSYYGKDTILYNSNNAPYYSFKKYWDNSSNQWRDLQRTYWTYDASNRLVSRSIQDWNSGMNWWQNDVSDFYSYDSNGRTIHDSSYVNGGALRYYNNCVLAGIYEKNHDFEFSIFPNPTNSTLSITSSVDYNSVKIINSIGQTIANFEDKPTTISVADLSNGIYFIQLLDKKGTILKTEKFIKN